jgi:CBS domain-containing protein
MTTTVQEFVKDKAPVESVTLFDTVAAAVNSMTGNAYSQLPVVDAENRPVGLITSESVLSTLNNFGTDLTRLRIKHIMLKIPQTFNQNIDLLDLIEGMKGHVALIVDDDDRLVQIVTDFDTAAYFRKRATDTILVENIETMLRDFVQLAFSSEPDGETLLKQRAQSLNNSTSDLRAKIKGGLHHYLNRQNGIFDAELFDEAFQSLSAPDKDDIPGFDQLTLANYIDLFLANRYWARYEAIFELDKTAMHNLLNSVRQTRNDLFHFREISAAQSDQLKYCYSLLYNHQDEIYQAFAKDDADDEEIVKPGQTTASPVDEQTVIPVEDEPAPHESRYAPLAIWLQGQPPEKNIVKPSFAKIEEIIGGKLPESAYKHRAWWANDSVSHVQSRLWLDVGWRVASVSMTKQVVRFARIEERQKAYIDFFSALSNALSEKPEFASINMRPDGQSWHFIRSASADSRVTFNYAFGRGGVFRVEVYIDTEDQQTNKQLFDALHDQKEEIEAEFGHELLWQRLDNRRASRIARVFKGQITDSDEELERLWQRVVPATVSLERVFEPRLTTLAKTIL